MTPKMNSDIPSYLRKLMPVSILLFLILRNASSISSALFSDLFYFSGAPFWISFLISEVIPLAAVSFLAYSVSNQIWNKTLGEKINLSSLLIRYSIIVAVLSATSLFYPYFTEELFGLKQFSDTRNLSQMVASSTYKIYFNYAEIILLILLVSLGKTKSTDILDERI